MAKFQSPLLGYNNNVRHKNRVFHIQTEDSGVNHPHIITHLFMDGGRILKSVKKSYAEHVGADGMNDIVRGLMKEQHKAIFIALRDGQFDDLVDPGAAAKAAATAAAAAARAAAAVESAATDAATAPIVPVVDVAAIAAQAKPIAEADLGPQTIDHRRGENTSSPRGEAAPATPVVLSNHADDAPTTTRQAEPPGASAQGTPPSARELTLDFDALEEAAQEALPAPSLFHTSQLPPPPKNLFAREPGTGAYRAVDNKHGPEASTATRLAHPRDPRDPHARHDPREEPSRPPAARGEAIPPSTRGERAAPARGSARAKPGSRPPAEARYAPARPAAIFGSTHRPPPSSLFSDELVSDKSLDEVILSYLAEDLEPPRQK